MFAVDVAHQYGGGDEDDRCNDNSDGDEDGYKSPYRAWKPRRQKSGNNTRAPRTPPPLPRTDPKGGEANTANNENAPGSATIATILQRLLDEGVVPDVVAQVVGEALAES